jgi:hypothetical protein
MFALTAKITIKSAKTWVFTKINSCEIERDIENVTTKCTLILPKKTKWHNETAIPVKRGDRITIQLGYDGNNEEVFTGHISKVTAKTPVTIECEDEMYLLKNTATKKKSYSSANLKTLLSEQCQPGTEIEVFSTQTFGKYVVNADTVAQMLGDLRENGFLFFFKNGTLYAGMTFDYNSKLTGKKQVFKDGESGNIIDDGDLIWAEAENTSLRIKATGIDSAGNKIQVEVGDKEGETRSFYQYNTTKAQLGKEAKKRLADWKVSGFTGSFTTFGAKIVWPLDLIKIKTEEHPEGGIYKAIKNTINYSARGYRQNITIGGVVK